MLKKQRQKGKTREIPEVRPTWKKNFSNLMILNLALTTDSFDMLHSYFTFLKLFFRLFIKGRDKRGKRIHRMKDLIGSFVSYEPADQKNGKKVKKSIL
jgi:hypothetical protein